MTYDQQLKDKRWVIKRIQIKKRDNNECQVCMSTKKLCVHHKKYIFGAMAWEYEDKYLITLCDHCHKLFHHLVKPPKVEVKANNGFTYSENDLRHIIHEIPVNEMKIKPIPIGRIKGMSRKQSATHKRKIAARNEAILKSEK